MDQTQEKLLDDLERYEERTWPEGTRASRENFAARLRTFSEGFLIEKTGGEIAGVCTAEIINYDPDKPPLSWEEVTDNGSINTHDPSGNALYIVSIGVDPKYQGKGVGSSLLNRQKELARSLGLQYVVLGSRVPFYHQHKEVPVEDYVETDPEIRFYRKNSFEMVKIVPNYMEYDKESLNYGVVMHCKVS